MFDHLLDDTRREVRDRARRFAKEVVPAQLIRDMDADRIRYPREFLGCVPVYTVVDVATGRSHSLRPAGIAITTGMDLIFGLPGDSPLAPDGRHLLFIPLGGIGGSPGAVLYTIPADWP